MRIGKGHELRLAISLGTGYEPDGRLCLKMHILNMDRRFININYGDSKSFTAFNDMKVESVHSPELGPHTVYLCGIHSNWGSGGVRRYFNSINILSVYKKRLINALEDWANRAPEFREGQQRLMYDIVRPSPPNSEYSEYYDFYGG